MCSTEGPANTLDTPRGIYFVLFTTEKEKCELSVQTCDTIVVVSPVAHTLMGEGCYLVSTDTESDCLS